MQRILHGKPPQRNISTGESSQFPVSAAGLDLVSCLGLHLFFSRKHEARVPTKEIDFFATGQHADSFLAHVFWIWGREASTSLIKPHITTPNHPVIRRDCTTHLLVLLLLKSIFQCVFSHHLRCCPDPASPELRRHQLLMDGLWGLSLSGADRWYRWCDENV